MKKFQYSVKDIIINKSFLSGYEPQITCCSIILLSKFEKNILTLILFSSLGKHFCFQNRSLKHDFQLKNHVLKNLLIEVKL